MKRLITKYCILFVLLTGLANAQPHLRVSSLINWPDTAYQNQVFPVISVVENIGTAVFQAPLQIVLKADSNVFSYLYYNSTATVTILPGDTVHLSQPGGYLFDSAVFKPGNNVVVVWPFTTQTAAIDTFQTVVYFNNLGTQGLNDPKPIPGLAVYPNPAQAETYIYSPTSGLERVRILDAYGREISTIPGNRQHKMNLPLEGLPAGIYLLEIFGTAGDKSIYRILRTMP
jgi:hypothetical protein